MAVVRHLLFQVVLLLAEVGDGGTEMTRRIAVNMVVFAVVTISLLAYGVFDLLGNPFSSPTVVYAVFPSASGLSSGFPVSWNGVDVGSVSSVSLVVTGARVAMSIDPGTELPSDVHARINIANDLGEQQVDLVALPLTGKPDPPLKDGSTIPVLPDSTPAQLGQVVSLATNLLKAIPAGSLNELINELAVSLQGRSSDIRTLINAGQVFANEALSYQSEFKSLLSNAPPVLNTLSSVGTQLRQSIYNTSVLASVLATHRYQLIQLLSNGANAASDAATLVQSRGPDMACLIHDLGATDANLTQPNNLYNLNTTLASNNYFFGAIDGVSQFGPSIALAKGAPARADQEWLRTRIVFPPAYPQGDQYAKPTELPPVKPGAACVTELGNGAGAATQLGFTPYGTRSSPPGHLELASSRDAVVAGTGPLPSGANPSSYRRVPEFSGMTLPLTLAALCTGMMGLLVGLMKKRAGIRVGMSISKLSKRSGLLHAAGIGKIKSKRR